MIRVSNLKKEYNLPNGKKVLALEHVNLDFEEAGLSIIRGKSGSGKSTLLNLLAGLDRITDGEIRINNVDITNYSMKQWDDIRNRDMGIVFQSYSLIESMSVRENLLISLDLLEKNEQVDSQIQKMLEFVGMPEYESRKVQDLSGGQRQRIAIARALIKEPTILLADEPTGNLDEVAAEDIFKLFQKAARKCCVIVITHDDELAVKYGERLITIEKGKISSDIQNPNIIFRNGVKLEVTGSDLTDTGEDTRKTFFAQKEFLAYLEDVLLSEQGNGNTFTVRASYEAKKKNIKGKDRKRQEKKEKSKVKRLSKLFILHLILEGLKRRKLRLLATAFVMSIACFLLFMTVTLVFYNKNDVIGNCITKKNITYVEPYISQYYVDLFNNEQSHNAFTGALIEKKLNQFNAVGSEYYGVLEDRAVFNGDLSGNCYLIAGEDFSAFDYNLIGKYPKAANEIVITDYIGNQIGITQEDIGNAILWANADMKLTGIIDTGYVKDDILQRVEANQMNNDSMTDLWFKYQIALVSTKYVSQLQQNAPFIYLKASNFYIHKQEENYLDGRLGYGDVEKLKSKKVKLTWGRYPESEDELIVSTQFAQNEGFQDNLDIIGERSYKYLNLSDEHFKNAYSDYLNLYNIMGKTVKIVGEYNSSDLNNRIDGYPNIYITHEKYAAIVEVYYKDYYYNSYFLTVSGNNVDKIVKIAEKETVAFNEPTIHHIYEFASFMNEYRPIMIAVFLVIFVLAMSMMGTFISINISDSTREIGIIRSLGVTTRDTINVYSAEALIVSVLSLVFANVWYYIGNRQINNWINNLLGESNVPLIYVKPQILFMAGAFIILMSGIIAMIPIRKFSKRNLVTLLKQ